MKPDQETAAGRPATSRAKQELERTRERFRLESERAPEPWKPALAEVASLLFAPCLELAAVRRRHKLMKPDHTAAFRAVFGRGLAALVRRWRVETGARLLGDHGLTLGQVANLVGFASAATFRSALRQVDASTPTAHRAAKNAEITTSAHNDQPCEAVAALRHFRCLAPDDASAAGLRQQLSGRLAHEKARRAEPLEPRLAQLAWQRSRELPIEKLCDSSRPELWFESTAVVDHLWRLSREEGRSDRRRGLELAQLALDYLETRGTQLPEVEHSHLLARAWLTVGNAQRLLSELTAAEGAFANAGMLLAGPEMPSTLRAELAYSWCELRRYQRRFADALALAEQAVGLSHGEPATLATALLIRGYVFRHLGEWHKAVEDYEAAVRELDATGNLYSQCVARQNLAASLFFWGKYEAAGTELERAKELAEKLGQAVPRYHTEWLEGLLAAKTGRPAAAKTHLTAAREGLRALGEKGHFAIASLDLAALGLEDEGLVALKLLQQAVADRQVRAALLEKVRESARRVAGLQPPEPT